MSKSGQMHWSGHDSIGKCLQDAISPWEPAFMRLQTLLIFRDGTKSIAFYVAIHVTFVYCYLCNHGTLTILSFLLLLLVIADMWKTYIWKEIKVPEEFDREDDWVPVEAHLASIQDVAQWVDERVRRLFALVAWARRQRRNRRLRFFLTTSATSALIAYLGTFFHGWLLGYVAMMSLLLYPPYKVYRWPQVVLPYLQQLNAYLAEHGKLEDDAVVLREETQFIDRPSSIRAAVERQITQESSEEEEDELRAFLPVAPPTSASGDGGSRSRQNRQQQQFADASANLAAAAAVSFLRYRGDRIADANEDPESS
uniref:Reticulon-like protein n=2 Tax=Macrostomum lignano TaxID=282301 RepID=A0A1I8GNA4_9PLAT